MKKQLITGALIVVIGVSTFFAQKEAMKIADIRADEIYSATVAQAAKALPRTTVQRVVNTPEEKKFLNALVNQEFRGESFTERTISGKLMVMHEDKFGKDGRPLVEKGENIHKLYLVTPTDIYKVENIAYPVFEELNGIEVSLSGLLFANKDKDGYKKIVVNIPEEKIRKLKPVSSPVKNWKSLGIERDNEVCEGNYCVFVVLIDLSGDPSVLPNHLEIHDYIFTNPARIKNALHEQSYGQMIYGGLVTNDWISMPSLGSLILNTLSIPSEIQQYILSNNLDLNGYDQIMYLVNDPNNNWGGLSNMGPHNYSINGQIIPLVRSVVKMGPYNDLTLSKALGNLTLWDHTYIHETGHAVGAYHDNFLNCENGPSSLPSECLIEEYGNPYSTMGTGNYGSHFSFHQNLRIGWVDLAQIPLGNNESLSLNPLELSNPSFVKTSPDLSTIPGYVFEFRKPVGFDAINSKIDRVLQFNGLFVYRSSPYNSSGISYLSYLTDVSPAISSGLSGQSKKDVILKNLQSIDDVNNNKQLTGVYNLGGFSSSIESIGGSAAVQTTNSIPPVCVMRPIKIFNRDLPPSINNIARNQLPSQDWPGVGTFAPDLSSVYTVEIDNTDLDSEVPLGMYYLLFNDDSYLCMPTQYERTILLDGQIISTGISDSYGPWNGPIYGHHGVIIPGYNLSYGQHTITFVLNKLNNGSSVSYDFIFEVAPI